MITLNVLNDVITGSFDKKNFGVAYDEKLYKKMVKLQAKANAAQTFEELRAVLDEFEPLTIEDFKKTIEGASSYLHHNSNTGKTYLKYNNVVSNVPIPKVLVDRMNEAIEKKIDIMPDVKFIIRALRNPKLTPDKFNRLANYISITYTDPKEYNRLIDEEGLSHEAAVARATTRQTPITEEGLLQTYKVSKEVKHKFDKETGDKVDRYKATFDEDTGLKSYEEPEHAEERLFEPAVMGSQGDAFECNGALGHFIRVGAVHRLVDWDQVDCSDNRSCVKGLHVGNLDYIRGYQNSGTVTHYVFVDPMFVGAIPDDRTGAIRCKEYMIYGTFVGPTKSLYRSSDYAKQTDTAWAEMLKEAVKEKKAWAKEQADIAKEDIEQLEALA